MKTSRIKNQPLTSRREFLGLIAEIAALEAQARALAAARDIEIAAVQAEHETRIAPLAELIKGKFALVEAYADHHRDELLPKGKKSTTTETVTYGWRTGNRTVKLMSRVTEEQAIAALKGLSLGAYVRKVEEIAKSLILCDCEDDKHLIVATYDPAGEPNYKDGKLITRTVPLANVGLRIAQPETFFIEPASADANTVQAASPAPVAG